MRNFDHAGALIAIVTGTISLSGCASTVQGLAQSQDTNLLNPDSVQGVRKEQRRQESSRRLRGNNAECSGTATPPSFTFFCAQHASEEAWDTSSKAHKYLLSGLTLSNETCNEWFSRLQITQVTLRQSSDIISASGSVTAAILAFTRTPSQTIGLTASIFGVGKQATDNLSSNYVVAADLPSVTSAVREYRSLYAAQIEAVPESSWNYYTARRVIMGYDNTCSALFVRRFINSRVEGSTTPDTEPLVETAIASFANESDKFFNKKLTNGQLIDVYTYLFAESDAPPAVVARLKKALTEAGILKDDGSPTFKDGVDPVRFLREITYRNLDRVFRERARRRIGDLTIALQREAEEAQKQAKKLNEEAIAADVAASTAETDATDAERDAKASEATALTLSEQVAALRSSDPQDTDKLAATQATSEAATAAAALARAKANTARQAAQNARSTAAELRRAADTKRAESQSAPLSGATTAAAVPSAPDGRPLDIPPKL